MLAVVAAVFAAPAGAAVVTREDSAGRTITFDVRIEGADVNTRASVLRRALHGDEIETLVVRLVGRGELLRSCGRRSVSCYRGGWRRGVVILPALPGPAGAAVLLHEYAHHLDSAYNLTSSWRWEPEARRWWAARRIEERLRRGEVTWDYEFGWQRSIGEILAEDYVQLHARPKYGIQWLPAPNRAVVSALRTDIREALATEFRG